MNEPRYPNPRGYDPDEYDTCTRRGHQPLGEYISIGDTTWSICRFCGIRYRFTEPELVECEDDLALFDELLSAGAREV